MQVRVYFSVFLGPERNVQLIKHTLSAEKPLLLLRHDVNYRPRNRPKKSCAFRVNARLKTGILKAGLHMLFLMQFFVALSNATFVASRDFIAISLRGGCDLKLPPSCIKFLPVRYRGNKIQKIIVHKLH